MWGAAWAQHQPPLSGLGAWLGLSISVLGNPRGRGGACHAAGGCRGRGLGWVLFHTLKGWVLPESQVLSKNVSSVVHKGLPFLPRGATVTLLPSRRRGAPWKAEGAGEAPR